MNPLIVADESVDFAIIRALRDAGYSVFAIFEEYPGWSDAKVLQLAFEKGAYLITEDKDFGELTYRFKRPNHGILLIRMMQESGDHKAAMVLEVLQNNFARLENAFSVLEKGKLRINPL